MLQKEIRALVVFLLVCGCAQQGSLHPRTSVPTVLFVIDNGFRGPIKLEASAAGKAFEFKDDLATIDVPKNGSIRVKSLDAFTNGVNEVFKFDNGNAISIYDETRSKESVCVFELGRGGSVIARTGQKPERMTDDFILYYIGTYKLYEAWLNSNVK